MKHLPSLRVSPRTRRVIRVLRSHSNRWGHCATLHATAAAAAAAAAATLTCHDVNGISATHANGGGSQAAGVGRVGVSADHEEAGDGIVLQHCRKQSEQMGVL